MRRSCTLGTVAELLEADRASVIQHSPAERHTRTHLWVTTPGPPVSGAAGRSRGCARLSEARGRGPDEADERRLSRPRSCVLTHGVRRALARWWSRIVVGIISFATVTGERRWSPDLMARLRWSARSRQRPARREGAEVALRSALCGERVASVSARGRERLPKAELSEARPWRDRGRSAASVRRRVSVKWPTPTPRSSFGDRTGKGCSPAPHTHGPGAIGPSSR